MNEKSNFYCFGLLWLVVNFSMAGMSNAEDSQKDVHQRETIKLLRELVTEVKNLRKEVAEMRKALGKNLGSKTNQADGVKSIDSSVLEIESKFLLDAMNSKTLDQIEVDIEHRRKELVRSLILLKEKEKNNNKQNQSLQKSKLAIELLRKKLDENKDVYEFSGNEYTAKEVQTDLEERRRKYQNRLSEFLESQERLKIKRKTIEKSMANLKEQLNRIHSVRTDNLINKENPNPKSSKRNPSLP